MVALHILNTESEQQHVATASAEESLQLSENRYAGGLDTYLQVVIWQTTALANERNDIDIARRRLEASVLLIKALGGRWMSASYPRCDEKRPANFHSWVGGSFPALDVLATCNADNTNSGRSGISLAIALRTDQRFDREQHVSLRPRFS